MLGVLLVLALVTESLITGAFDGVRCQHSTQCDYQELCIADSVASTWGTCRRVKVLP